MPSRDWLAPLSIATAGLVSTVWLTLFAGVGKAGVAVALVFPPHWEAARAFTQAATLDVVLLGTTSLPFVIIAVPRTDDALDGFRSNGALLALNSIAAGLCGNPGNRS